MTSIYPCVPVHIRAAGVTEQGEQGDDPHAQTHGTQHRQRLEKRS